MLALGAGIRRCEAQVDGDLGRLALVRVTDAFSGTYESELYGRSDIVVDGDALRVEAGPAGYPAALPHFNRDTFLLNWGSVTSVPDPRMFVIGLDGIAVGFENGSLERLDQVTD